MIDRNFHVCNTSCYHYMTQGPTPRETEAEIAADINVSQPELILETTANPANTPTEVPISQEASGNVPEGAALKETQNTEDNQPEVLVCETT